MTCRLNLGLLTLMTLILGFTACEDDLPVTPEDTSVNLNFKLQYEDAPLVMFEDVNYPDGRKMRFSRISGYLSNISLINDGTPTEVKDVTYLVLSDSHNDLASAENGLDLNLNAAGIEDFDAISFNIGLTPEQNATLPADYLSDNDLSKVSEYWPGWESYVFFKFEGSIDLDNNGEYDAGESFALHLGSDVALRSKMINVSKEDNYEFSIAVDQVFQNGTTIYDIDSQRQIHSLTDSAIENIEFLSDNLAAAMFVK